MYFLDFFYRIVSLNNIKTYHCIHVRISHFCSFIMPFNIHGLSHVLGKYQKRLLQPYLFKGSNVEDCCQSTRFAAMLQNKLHLLPVLLWFKSDCGSLKNLILRGGLCFKTNK